MNPNLGIQATGNILLKIGQISKELDRIQETAFVHVNILLHPLL